MLNFDKFVSRHGEVAAQAIIENYERFMGLRHRERLSLENRWKSLLTGDSSRALAA